MNMQNNNSFFHLNFFICSECSDEILKSSSKAVVTNALDISNGICDKHPQQKLCFCTTRKSESDILAGSTTLPQGCFSFPSF